jgi:hypothetical protein
LPLSKAPTRPFARHRGIFDIAAVCAFEKTKSWCGSGAVGVVYISTKNGLALILDKAKNPLLIEGAIFKVLTSKKS